ncbi:MAG: hypothetical protein IPI67_02380 [Myxococcales bacterium]|nr:hypothetical protein [Myxococcales bacterium]
MGHLFNSLLLVAAVGSAAVLSATSCTAVDDQSAAGAGGTCVGPSCNPEDAGRDQIVADVPVPDSQPDAKPSSLNALCGTSGCLPDDPNPSECAAPPDVDAGLGVPDAAAADDASAGDSDAAPLTKYGCGVTSMAGQPTTECALAGSGESGSPCVSASDCSPGLACVSEGTTAACRPYCCAESATCGAGAFCAERTLKVQSGEAALPVPVCVPADGCSLDEPYPCPSTKQCKCKPGTACALVKDDGTTSCVTPGVGRVGEACPCAAGYLCSKSTETCLKLCSTTASKPECGSGKCLSVTGLPDGFGVCGLGSLGDAG